MALDEGWLYIPYVDGLGSGNEMQVLVEKVLVDNRDKPYFSDYAGDGHHGFSSKIYKRTIKIRKLKFKNKTDYDTFLNILENQNLRLQK